MEKEAISRFIDNDGTDFSNDLYRIKNNVLCYYKYVWHDIAIIEDDCILIEYSFSNLNVILKILKTLRDLNIKHLKIAFVNHIYDNCVLDSEYNVFFDTMSEMTITRFSDNGFDIFEYIFNGIFLPNRREKAYPIFLKHISDMRDNRKRNSYLKINSYLLAIERKVKIEYLTR